MKGPIIETPTGDGEPLYSLNPQIFAFARELEEELGRKPTLEEVADLWKQAGQN
jgi:hypothetical protein